MDRHNIRRVSTDAQLAWRATTRQRFHPAHRPVAIDRPREEQTWPTPLLVRTTPPRMTPNDEHPDWPGRKSPAVPAYQRRLDQHTDGVVRSFRSHGEGRTMAGRRRGLTTHRRPLAVVGTTLAVGRGTDEHEEAVFAGEPMVYRRLRFGGSGMVWDRVRRWRGIAMTELQMSAVVSPRRAVIAMMAVIVLMLGAMGTGLAQQRYVVNDGDTIESIAETFGVNPEGIRRSSYLPNGDNLQAGQVLVIPNPGQSPSEAALMAAELEGTSPWVSTAHWVGPDDTIASIAAMYGVGPQELVDFNAILDPDTINDGQRILIPAGDSGLSNNLPGPNAVVITSVGTHQQSRNLSCEYAAAYIATDAFGAGVDESVFIDVMPVTLNPHWGYRGNIDGQWGGTDDYGIYAEALAPVLLEHGFASHTFYTEGDIAPLKAQIDAGHPVLVWLGMHGDTRVRLHDDGDYSVAAGQHVMTVYGYDDNTVYLSDPGQGAYVSYSWDDFIAMWKVLDGMSLAVYPA